MSKLLSGCKLPDTLSGCIRVALHDLEACELQPEIYQIVMTTWHTWNRGTRSGKDRCQICLAGAVMAQSCRVPYQRNVSFMDFEDGIANKFRALDLIRQTGADWGIYTIPQHALSMFHYGYTGRWPEYMGKTVRARGILIPVYRDDPGLFKHKMSEMADALSDVGE